eukprot:Hpha_TRINITY_DN20776_c0_g1::TRINITY_DN20776_c0_g1_i1::g.33453::m.33453
MPIPAVVIGCVGNGCLLGISDGCAQLIEKAHKKRRRLRERGIPEEEEDVCYDFHRTARFAGIGVFLTGPLTYTRYWILGGIFGEAASAQAAVRKMVTNQLLFDPPETLIHLAGLEYLRTGGDWGEVEAKCKKDYWAVQIPGWALAIPVNLCTFSMFSTTWQQMLFQKSVSTCFNVYFSYVANRSPHDDEEVDFRGAKEERVGQEGGVGEEEGEDKHSLPRCRPRRRLYRRGGGHRRAPSGRGTATTAARAPRTSSQRAREKPPPADSAARSGGRRVRKAIGAFLSAVNLTTPERPDAKYLGAVTGSK